jgi:hypothetical protein
VKIANLLWLVAQSKHKSKYRPNLLVIFSMA